MNTKKSACHNCGTRLNRVLESQTLWRFKARHTDSNGAKCNGLGYVAISAGDQPENEYLGVCTGCSRPNQKMIRDKQIDSIRHYCPHCGHLE